MAFEISTQGTGEYVSSGGVVAAGGSGASSLFSIVFWLYSPDNASGSNFSNTVGCRQTDGEQFLTLHLKNNGDLSFFYRPNGFGNPSVSFTASGPVDDDTWHWIYVCRDADDDHSVYIDGTRTRENSTSVTTSLSPAYDDLFIGSPFGNTMRNGAKIGRYGGWSGLALTLEEARSFAYTGRCATLPDVHLEMMSQEYQDERGQNDGTATGGAWGTNPPVTPYWGIDEQLLPNEQAAISTPIYYHHIRTLAAA